MPRIVGPYADVPDPVVDHVRNSKNHHAQLQQGKLISSVPHEFPEATLRSNLTIKKQIRSKNINKGNKKTALGMTAIQVAPFWEDPRNLFLSNLIRASVTPLKENRTLTVNFIMTLIIGATSLQMGNFELFLCAQALYSTIDYVTTSGYFGRELNFMIGNNLGEFLKAIGTN